MSTSQSGEQEGGNYVTTQYCNASQEELLRGGKYEFRMTVLLVGSLTGLSVWLLIIAPMNP